MPFEIAGSMLLLRKSRLVPIQKLGTERHTDYLQRPLKTKNFNLKSSQHGSLAFTVRTK